VPARRVNDQNDVATLRPAATTPQRRENQLTELAWELAEKQIRDGTASAQVISHFLKMGSSREQLEQQRLRHENELTQAKIAGMAAVERIEQKYDAALKAMRRYSGQDEPEAEPVTEEYQ